MPHIFGIRHHGPGSARSLLRALEALQPDAILIEGPPDADGVISWAAHQEMKPPVALLVYSPETPRRAVYYPFALFSPEWQALRYALGHSVEVRFMDLPQAHQLAMPEIDGLPSLRPDDESDPEPSPEPPATPGGNQQPDEMVPGRPPAMDPEDPLMPGDSHPPAPDGADVVDRVREDPLNWLAKAAGYEDGERWWEQMVEHRRDGDDIFEAILEAMAELREAAPQAGGPFETHREAYMRQSIRAAERAGRQRIAVVCGAWHAPALARKHSAKEDAVMLRGLPKIKVNTTWVPWTYGRLALASGYGAGVDSPGWYHHLWSTRDHTVIRWMGRVAGTLRKKDLDASPAQTIEAVRLAETLAALRNMSLPGLAEINEAVLTTFCFGNHLPLQLIHDKLIVSERLGNVPEETPTVPLLADLTRQQKRLRLPAEAGERLLDLDLRKPNDLERSYLLHRLLLLGVKWGTRHEITGKGTFHEGWRLRWEPEFAVALIQAGVWGNTVYDAATAFTRNLAETAAELPRLTEIVESALLADLPEAIALLMDRLQELSALTSDVTHLMEALPPLVNAARYGNVRGTDAAMLRHVVDGMVARITIGLPGACASLDDAAAAVMFQRLTAADAAIVLLDDRDQREAWRGMLIRLSGQRGLHGLIAGRAVRLLMDRADIESAVAARIMGLALSSAVEPVAAAAWVEGFLQGSGLVLLHDEALWTVIDEWVTTLRGEAFTTLLPLLRRTFATFAAPERRQMAERVRRGTGRAAAAVPGDLDESRARAVLPLVARLLGLTFNPSTIHSLSPKDGGEPE